MQYTLRDALSRLAAALDLPHADLVAYANEDDCGGYHTNPALQRWPAGSTWAVEGQVLYALVRAMRPSHVVEIGTFRGAAATHILAAMARNDHGHLTCCDITGCGDMIPSHLLSRCKMLLGRGQDLIPTLEEPAEIVFEDASHDPTDVEQILRAVLLLHPKIVLSHDAEHRTIGHQVREGYSRVFGNAFETMLIAPSDCGFAYKVF